MTEPVTVRLLHVPAGHNMPPAPLIAAVRLARSRAKVCAGLRARITAARMAGLSILRLRHAAGQSLQQKKAGITTSLCFHLVPKGRVELPLRCQN